MKRTPELIDEDLVAEDARRHETPSDTPSRFPVLARFGLGVAGTVSLLILAIVVLPMILPASMTVTKAEEVVGDLLGIKLKIRGDHSIRLLPSVTLVASDIVAEPTGHVAELTVGSLEITASALSLVSGSLDISDLLIQQPNIRISPSDISGKVKSPDSEVHNTWGWWRDFQIERLSVTDGRAFVMQSNMADDIRITDITLMNVPPGSGEAEDGIAFDGKAIANGEEIALHVAASNPQLLITGNRWPLSGLVTSNFMSLGFTGSMALRERLVGTGSVKMTSADIGALNRWIGTKVPHREGDTLDVMTPFELSANTLDMRGVNLVIGATEASAMLKLTGLAGGQSQLDIDIDAEMIDFGTTPVASILANPGISLFPDLPGTMTLDWKAASWDGLTVGQGGIIAERTADSGALNVSLNKVDALGGILRGEMTLDKSEGMRALHLEGAAVGVSFQDLFQRADQITTPLITGNASIDIKLFSVGANPAQLFEALTGTARLQVQNGTLGVPELIEGLSGDTQGAIEFASLNGTFDIAQGIASSEDLLLQADSANLVARGNIDLADWTVEVDIGQLKSEDGERTLQRYRLFGPVRAVQFEAVN